jgi:uncharacterized protein
MSKSKVFFIDFHTSPKQNILAKLRNMLIKAGINSIDFNKKIVAVKIHFGEPGNMSYIRPNYAAVVVKMIQEKNGLVFLTDANTLYKGRRSNAVDHLQSAMENGFNPIAVGCNVIIADGVKGTDFREVVIDQKNCKTAKVGAAIADADIIISLNHFKGHDAAGFGGCLKNIGMGSGSIQGKHEMHSNSKPVIISENCTACRMCEQNCASDAIHVTGKKIAEINYETCIGCGQCIAVCQFDAAQVRWEMAQMQEKMAEYAYAVIKNKPAFHVNFLTDISPNCDCWDFNDAAIVPNIGILASPDPVALDKASADLVNEAPINQYGILNKNADHDSDKFKEMYPRINWQICLDYAEKIGIGTQQYELLKID